MKSFGKPFEYFFHEPDCYNSIIQLQLLDLVCLSHKGIVKQRKFDFKIVFISLMSKLNFQQLLFSLLAFVSFSLIQVFSIE